MAFAKKTWKDRIAEFPTRRRLTKEDNTSELVTVAREEGTLSQEGDAFSAENMNDLENRIDAEFTEVNGNLKGQIITKSQKKSITVPSYGYFTDITNVAVEGYTPLGIVEINSGTFVNAVGTFTVTDNTASIQFRCVTADGFNGNYSFKVLYSKN